MYKEYIPAYWEQYISEVDNAESTRIYKYRVVPIQQEVEACAEVLPYEKILDRIDEANVMGLAHCACREMRPEDDLPRETCMMFGEYASFLITAGIARKVTKEEMKETLKICDQAGLIRVTFNSQDDLTFICNCSAKSCLAMEPIIKAGRYSILPRSAFVPVLDSALCKGCGICANERCGLNALEMKDDKPFLNAELCIGCALCASGCPENARQMQKNPTIPEAPTTTQDLMQKILQERGKMEGFMELLMHPPQS